MILKTAVLCLAIAVILQSVSVIRLNQKITQLRLQLRNLEKAKKEVTL